MCHKLNALVLQQNALLPACMVLECIMSIVSFSAESHSAHMHTLPSCKETLVSAGSHSVAQVGKLGNNDMAVYTKDKCMNTITSLLATRKQQAKWIHLFFCPPESCCSQILSVCLPYVVQASCLVSQPTREIIYSRCLSSSRYMHNMYMLHEVEANCY